MGKRLPPGEAERRAKERARRTWSGENNKKYDPSKTGFGNTHKWEAAADALAHGDAEIVTSINADLLLFGLTVMPATRRKLSIARMEAAKKLHQKFGSDTASGYKDGFYKLTDAYNRLLEGLRK